MSRFRLKYSELEDKVKFCTNGDLIIRDNVSDEDYKKYLEIRDSYSKYRKYHMLYNFYGQIMHSWENRIYYVPADIYEYMYFKNLNIIEKKPVPAELKEKFLNCKRLMDVEFNYFGSVNYIGGYRLGLTLNWKLLPFVIIRKSKENRISNNAFYYEILEWEYIKKFDEREKNKEYYLQHGYKE